MGSTSHPNEAESCRKAILKILEERGKIWRDLPELLAMARKRGAAGSGSAPPPPPASMPPSPGGDQITPLELFKVVRALFQRFVHVQSPHHHTAFALWTLHCHIFDQFRHTPRLLLSSAIEGEGKTTVLEVLEQLVPRAFDEKVESMMGDSHDGANRIQDPHWNKGASHEWGSLIPTICVNVWLRQSKPVIPA